MVSEAQVSMVKLEVSLPLDVAAAVHNAISQQGTSLDAFVREAVLAALAAPAVSVTTQGEQGYRWKTLLLPEGTELSFHYKGVTHIARVEGGQVLHDGKPVSPSQFVCGVAGQTRNAWRDLSVRRPGDPGWIQAEILREAIEEGMVGSIKAAATAMAGRVGTAAEALVSSLGEALPTKQGVVNAMPDRSALLKALPAVSLNPIGAVGSIAGAAGAALVAARLYESLGERRRRKAKSDQG